MVAQNKKGKKMVAIFFLHSWMLIDLRPSHLTKVLNSLDSSRTYRRLLESPKPGSSRELSIPENGFKPCYTVYFSKKHPDLGGLEINGRHEIQTWFLFKTSLYIVTQYNMKIVLGT